MDMFYVVVVFEKYNNNIINNNNNEVFYGTSSPASAGAQCAHKKILQEYINIMQKTQNISRAVNSQAIIYNHVTHKRQFDQVKKEYIYYIFFFYLIKLYFYILVNLFCIGTFVYYKLCKSNAMAFLCCVQLYIKA